MYLFNVRACQCLCASFSCHYNSLDIWDRPTTKTLLSQIDIGNQRSFSSRHCNLKDLSRLPTVTVTLESGVNAIDAKSALEGMNTAPAMEKTTSEEEATTATTTITGSSRCAICLAPFKPGISYEVRTLANCDHRCFHRNCLDRWLLGISSDQRTITNCCPVCKAPALAPDASTTSSAVDEFVSPQYPPTYSSASSKIASGSLKSKLHITPALANDADTRQQNEGTDVASAEPVAGEGNQSNNSASEIERNSDEQAFEYVSSEDDTCIDDDWVWSSCSSNSSNDSRASGAMESERCLNDSIAKPMTSINLATSILPDIPGLVSPRSENDAIEDFSTMNSGTMDASVGEAQLVLSALSLVGDEEKLVVPLSKNSAHQSCGAVTIESENISCPLSQEIRCREQSKVTVDDAQNDTLTEQFEDDAHIISVSDIPSWSFVEAGTSLQMIDKPHG